jgi:predicted nucleic acid-binding protein
MTPTFIDTNIIVYAYDADAGDKHIKARNILRECWEAESGIISTQVLQEFYVAITNVKKMTQPISSLAARDVIQTYHAWTVYRPAVEDILAASELSERYRYSFWDSLIIIAAQMSGVTTLFSEDMQHGQQIGSVKIINPFNE